LPREPTGTPASRRSSQPGSASWSSTSTTRSGQRAARLAVKRGSNACTAAHASNLTTPSPVATRSTVDQGRSCATSIECTVPTRDRIHDSTSARTHLA
jgi:hypothetical protein